MTKNAQWRRIAQLDQRWQRESEQQDQGTAAGEKHGRKADGRQVALNDIGEHFRHEHLENEARDTANCDTKQSQQNQLYRCRGDDKLLTGPKALHQRDSIHASVSKPSRRHRDGDGA